MCKKIYKVLSCSTLLGILSLNPAIGSDIRDDEELARAIQASLELAGEEMYPALSEQEQIEILMALSLEDAVPEDQGIVSDHEEEENVQDEIANENVDEIKDIEFLQAADAQMELQKRFENKLRDLENTRFEWNNRRLHLGRLFVYSEEDALAYFDEGRDAMTQAKREYEERRASLSGIAQAEGIMPPSEESIIAYLVHEKNFTPSRARRIVLKLLYGDDE